MRRLIALMVAAVAAGSAIVAVTAFGASAPTKPATVKTRTAGDLGKILVDGKSRTLYLFRKDKNGKSTCGNTCAAEWPPLLTKGKPKARSGAMASKLGTTKRSDGTMQVTYNKHPLYMFDEDKNKPGSTKGEGVDAFGAKWYVVNRSGSRIKPQAQQQPPGY